MPETTSKSLRLIISFACIIIIIAGFRAADVILVPFFLSFFIAIICAPVLFWLQRHKVPTAIAVLIIITAISILTFFFITFVSSSITEFARRLPVYQAQLKSIIAQYLEWFDKVGIQISNETFFEYFDPGVAMRLAANTLMRLRGLLTNGLLILLTVIFILLEASGFSRKLLAALGTPDQSLQRFEHIATSINHYLGIKSIFSLITGALIALLLILMGVDFPLLWGMLAFLLNYVPTIGPIIAAIPAILLTMVQLGLFKALLVGIGYAAVNVILGAIIEPKLLGRRLGLSTLVVFLSLVFWGWVLGPIGMLLSVPLTMIVKIGLEASEDTRWIAVLLGPEPDDSLPEIDSDNSET